MKSIYKLVAAVFFLGTLVSCEQDLIVFDAQNGQTAISFGETSYTLSVPQEDLVLSIPVNVTTASSAARSFNVTVDSTTGSAGEFTVGTVTIPAGSYTGTLDVSFDWSAITGADGETKDVVLSISPGAGETAYFDTVSITYFREVICNDVLVSITFDNYPEETAWTIAEQGTGTVVASGGPYPGASGTFEQTVNLPDGCYTYTINDAFSDGICCAYGDGSYSVTCSIITHASGGTFGASESTDFCVNP